MTATTTATQAATSQLVDELMQLGAELPMTIAQMDTLQRFTTVGALFAAGELPNEEIATALLFHPEHVLMIPAEVFEQGRAQLAAETTPDDGGFLAELARALGETGSVEYPQNPYDMTAEELNADIIATAQRIVAKRADLEPMVTDLLALVGLEMPDEKQERLEAWERELLNGSQAA
jgi:hypothetical protein